VCVSPQTGASPLPSPRAVPARPTPTSLARPSLRVVATVDVPQNSSANIIFDEGRERVYLLSLEGQLVAIDAKTNTVSSTLAVSKSDIVVSWNLAIDPVSGRIFVYFVNESSSFGGSLAVIDANTNSDVATIAPRVVGDFGIGGMAVNPATGCVYIGNFSNAVAVVDGTTNSQLGSIDFDSQTFDVAVDAVANRVFVLTGAGVAVIDGSSNVVVNTVGVGNGRAIAVNTRTGRVYVSSGEGYGDGAVTVLDGQTGLVLKTLTVMNRPENIAADSSANRIYVANIGSGTVSVIDGATDEVVATATVAHAMGEGIAADPRTGRIYIFERYAPPNTLQVLQ
jgi:YVTN family beta-propeller protein